MDSARIAELLAPFLGGASGSGSSSVGGGSEMSGSTLSPLQLERISTYIDILVRWNARVNLTAIRDAEDIVTRHFGESLFAARHLFVKSANARPRGYESESIPTRVVDIGSGAGFPGLPLKLWAPEIALTLIESNHKKATFLREVTRALELNNVEIRNVRAETLVPEQFDVVTFRAVERFSDVLPEAANLVAKEGTLALLIGSSQLHEAQAKASGFHWSEPLQVPNSASRIFLAGCREPKE